MPGTKVRRSGVRINGKWYWDMALYGLYGWVYYDVPKNNTVALYNRQNEQICTATLL